MSVSARTVQAVIACLCVAASAAAQPVPEARVQELVRQAMAQAPPAVAAAVPGSLASVDLKIDEAVARALERNLDIAVERINPQAADLTVASVLGTYRPVVSSTLAKAFQVQLPTSQLVGGTRVENETGTANVGASWNVPWFGGLLTAGWNNRRQDSTNLFTTFTPQFNTSTSFSYTQPLLRNLRIDATRQQLLITRINSDVSEVQLQATIANTMAGVRNAYWDLLAARQAVEVAQRSVALAEKLVEDNKVRVEVGALAPIDVYQAEAEAATRRQTLVAAESTAKTAELALKRLIVSGTDDALWGAAINPVDRPTWQPVSLDVPAAIRKALAERTDLQIGRKQLDANQVRLRYTRDQTLPGIDLLANYGLQGIGGTRYVRQGTGGDVLAVIPGGYGDAWEMMWAKDYPQWTAQVTFSYPIGQSSAEASFARAKLQVTQAQAQLRQLELTVATEVTNLASQVQSNRERVDAATAARELAEKRLEAEQSKFEVGMSTNFFVVQAQRDLFDAQLTELRARLDYQKSVVDYDRVQQSSLTRTSLTTVTVGGS